MINRSPEAQEDRNRIAQEAKKANGGEGHITTSGLYFSTEEWAEAQAAFEAEAQEASDYIDKQNAILSTAAKMLEKLGMGMGKDKDNYYGLASYIYNNGSQDITFTSDDKRQAVEEIEAWMTLESKKLGY